MARPILLLVFCLMCGPMAHADTINAPSTISDVTIYSGLAIVTRQAEVSVPQGDHTILFDNIIPQINDNTLTVKGEGSAQVKIFGAVLKRDYLTEAGNEHVKVLQDQLQSIDDQINVVTQKQGVLNKEVEYLDSIKFKAGEQLPKDLITKMPQASELESLGNFLSNRYDTVNAKSEALRLSMRDLQKKKNALENELSELQGGMHQEKRSIAVEIQCDKPGKLTLMVSYAVYNVNWMPIYDARVDFKKSQVELSLFGQISQQTGEDWEGVDLTISTSRPSIGGRMPELAPWYLSIMVPQAPGRTRVMKRLQASHYEADMGMAAEKAKANESFDLAAPTSMPAQVAYAQIDNSGINAVFKITKKIDIKTDGTWHRVPITVLNMPVNFEYATTPKLNDFAYLKSLVTNNQDSVLLPGAVNIFLDGNYVGNSTIDKAIGNKEQFDLYLGVDEGVTIKRKLLEQKTDDTFIGGIPSANRSISFSYKITVENYKGKPINVHVYDQVPVSQDDKIKVKSVKFTPEPTKKDIEDKTGVMMWDMTLNPTEKKDIIINYTVEHPRNLNILGL